MPCSDHSRWATWIGRAALSLPTTSWRQWRSAHWRGTRRGLEVLKRYDWEFHQALLSACGSRVLLDSHAAVFDKYLRYLMIAVIFRDRAAQEHQKLLECALKRDAKGAQAILATHIMDCVAYTLSHAPSGLLGPRRATAVQASEIRRPSGHSSLKADHLEKIRLGLVGDNIAASRAPDLHHAARATVRDRRRLRAAGAAGSRARPSIKSSLVQRRTAFAVSTSRIPTKSRY